MERVQDLTKGRIFGPLIRFALPVLLALFLQTMYGAVDLLVVGQFGASADVSAVATGSMIMHAVTVVMTGLAMGLTVLVARKIGEGKKEGAGEIIGSGIWLFGVLALALSVIMVIAAPATARIMHAPVEAFDRTVSYITICSVGAVFIVAYNLVGSIFRGIGDSTMPLLTVAIACVLNIIGDLILVAGFQLGTAGAAIATVFAQAVSVALSIAVIRRRALPFTLQRTDIRPKGTYIRGILSLGIPIALQDLLVNISFLAITAIAYMQSMAAFVAQNMGAGKPARARRALLCGIASSLLAGIVMGYLTFFHGDLLAGLFAKEYDVIAAAAEYLKAYAIDCLLTSFLFCFMGYFNGTGDTVFVMVQGIVGAFGVRLPVSWLVSRQPAASLFHIGLATPASSLVQIILCGAYFAYGLHIQKKKGPGA